MRLGIISYGLGAGHGIHSGITRYTAELTKALSSLSTAPDIVLLTTRTPRDTAAQNGFECVPLRGCRLLPGLVTLGNLHVPHKARKHRLDIVHDPTGVTPFLFGAGRARTVVTVHDVFPWSFPGTSTALDTFIYRQWLPRALPRVHAIITDSLTSKSDIAQYLGISDHKMHVIPLAVSHAHRPATPECIASIRARYGLPDDYLLFTGSVEKRKNLQRLLQAVSLLQQASRPPTLVVAGTRQRRYTDLDETINKLGLAEHVLFTGYVPEDDLPALYSGASLFVFPSLYEGFGLPPLEAMACGTPVVCSNAGSLPEVVGDAAITVDPYDVEGLAEAMARVLSDTALQADLRAKGLERARQFTWERTARETIKVYEKVLA